MRTQASAVAVAFGCSSLVPIPSSNADAVNVALTVTANPSAIGSLTGFVP